MANTEDSNFGTVKKLIKALAGLRCRLRGIEYAFCLYLLNQQYGMYPEKGEIGDSSGYGHIAKTLNCHPMGIKRAVSKLESLHIIIKEIHATRFGNRYRFNENTDEWGTNNTENTGNADVTSNKDATGSVDVTGNKNDTGVVTQMLSKIVTRNIPNNRLSTIENQTIKNEISENAKKFTELLKSLIIKNNPDALPNPNGKWGHVFDLMMERDKRTPELIDSVMRFSQSDDFWKTNILSPEKLRKHFDQLTLKMNTDKGVKNDGHKPIDPDKW